MSEPADEPHFKCNLARYHLYTGNPDEALHVLPAYMSENNFDIVHKALEIQILYETRSNLLAYRMDAFRLFLKRNAQHRITPEHLSAYRSFLNILAQIVRCPLGDKRRTEVILSRIRANPCTNEYVWLLGKAEEKGRGALASYDQTKESG